MGKAKKKNKNKIKKLKNMSAQDKLRKKIKINPKGILGGMVRRNDTMKKMLDALK